MEFQIRPLLEIGVVLAVLSGLTFAYFRVLKALAAGFPAFVREAREMRGLRSSPRRVAAPSRVEA